MKQRNIYCKLISILLAVAFALEMIPLDSYAISIESMKDEVEMQEEISDSDKDNEKPDEVEHWGNESIILSEVDDLREEKVKHFFTDDGSFIAVSYLNPIHFDVGGELEDIDNSLIFSAEKCEEQEVTGYRPLQSPLDVFFTEESGKGDTVYFSEKGYQISWAYLSEQGENRKLPFVKEENGDIYDSSGDNDNKENTINSEKSEDGIVETERDSEPDVEEINSLEEKDERFLDGDGTENPETYEGSSLSKAAIETEETEGEPSLSQEDKEDSDNELEIKLEAGEILDGEDDENESNVPGSSKAEIVELNTFDTLEGNERFLSLPKLS
ncbi:MAG: hypothetical protein MJ097_05950, partial [Dorea sp.]|nr:hypothetical protein [Dorea sp.]